MTGAVLLHRRRGRPDKLTMLSAEERARFLAVLRLGCPQTVACRLIGISYETLRLWRTRAESAPDAEPYASFIGEVEQAEAQCCCEAVVILNAVARGERLAHALPRYELRPDWRAIAWWLERRFPKKWGPTRRVEIDPEHASTTGEFNSKDAGARVRAAFALMYADETDSNVSFGRMNDHE